MMPFFAQSAERLSLDLFLQQYWRVLVPGILALTALTMLLPRGRSAPLLGGFLGGAALALAGAWWVHRTGPLPEIILFYAFAGLGILGGALMITRTNPVHAALSFALVILSSCGLFLLLAAPFLMAATIIIYAGAIVVTFLFVIMLAQQTGVSSADALSREPFLASLAGIILLIALVTVFERNFDRAHASQMQADVKSLREVAAAPSLDGLDLRKFKEQLVRLEAGLEKNKSAQEPLRRLTRQLELLEKADPDDAAADLEIVQQSALQLAVIARTHPLLVSDKVEAPLNPQLPAANVRAIGKSLFTDYLVAVEIGAVLLLVATIGAIVIAGRQEGELK